MARRGSAVLTVLAACGVLTGCSSKEPDLKDASSVAKLGCRFMEMVPATGFQLSKDPKDLVVVDRLTSAQALLGTAADMAPGFTPTHEAIVRVNTEMTRSYSGSAPGTLEAIKKAKAACSSLSLP